MITPQTLKGFRDFLPREAIKRDWLKKKIIEVFERWGYDPLETPTLEPLEIFAGQIGEDEKLFYSFTDHGGRNVALRYDQTVPTCRVVGQYHATLPMPFRRYQIQNAFRAENTQRGRYREFLQCDADIFGTVSPLADAEVIALCLDIYRHIGFPHAVVRINDRSLYAGIPYEAITAIDKMKKIGEDGVIADMVKKNIRKENAIDYLARVKNLEPNETIRTILTYLETAGFPKDWYAFDPTIARSFAYSSGPIWEVVIPEYTAGSVLGGERYDKLVEKISGVSIPATGFAVGFDRTLEAAEQFHLLPDAATTTQILVTVFSDELTDASVRLAATLRGGTIRAELFPDSAVKLDKQLKYADKKGIPYVAIIGPDEAKNGTVTLKTMKTKEQKTIHVKDLIEELRLKIYV